MSSLWVCFGPLGLLLRPRPSTAFWAVPDRILDPGPALVRPACGCGFHPTLPFAWPQLSSVFFLCLL